MADETVKAIEEQNAVLQNALESVEEKSNRGFNAVVNGLKKVSKTQHETTRQLMSEEDRAADDVKREEQFRVRSEAATQGHETRLAEAQNEAADADADANEEGEKSTSFLGRIAKQFDIEGRFKARQAEAKNKEEGKDSKMLGYLKSTAGFLGGIAKQGMEKVKSGLSGFSKFAFGGLALAALAFLNSPNFEKIKNTIMDVIIPLLADLYDYILKPLAEYLGGKIKDLLKDLKAYIDGDKGLGDVILDNIGIIAGIVTALAPGLVFGVLKTAVLGIGKALLWASAKTGITAAITAGFTAIKSFFVLTLKPFLATLAAPFGLIIVAAAVIVSAVYALKHAFDDFMFELKATGSAWEATKTAFVSFFANFLGFIPNLIKDAVSWIIGKFGDIFGIDTSAVTKALDKFDFVDFIADIFKTVGNFVGGIVQQIKDAIQNFLRKGGILGNKTADLIFGTKEEQAEEATAKAEEQKRFEEARKALREKQRLEEEEKKRVEEAKKLVETKKKEEAMMVTKTAPAAAKLDTKVGAYGNLGMGAPIVNAPVSNRSTNTSNHISSSSTSLINQDRIFDKLSFVG